MAKAVKKHNRITESIDVPIILVLLIIIATFLGSALLFWGLNTNALRSSVAAETTLSSSLLADDINKYIPKPMLLDGSADSDLSEEFQLLESKIENINDVWIVDNNGQILYRHVSETDLIVHDPEAQGIVASYIEDTPDDGILIRWFGKSSLFLLRQQCCSVRPLYEGGLFLVMVNHANSDRARQRQQFALLMLIDVMLTLVMIVLVVNTSVKYRRQIIRFSTTDELTGIANRKSFSSEFSEFISADRVPPFSLFLLDIDYFKQINDNYGHAAGDHALSSLAQMIKDMVTIHDGLAGRWGGDEFIGILPLRGEEALSKLRELCQRVAAAEYQDGFKMSISAGVVFADKETHLKKLSEKADLALYESKENGRNQANLYKPGTQVSPEPQGAPLNVGQYTPGASAQTLSAINDSPVLSASAVTDDASASKKHDSQGFTTAASAAALDDHPTEASSGDAALNEKTRTAPSIFKRSKDRISAYVRGKLLTSTLLGVRWMARFVAGGGILIALAFIFDAASVDLSTLTVSERAAFGSITAQAATLKNIGGITFNFMLPVFAGFMAYGIAGEEAFLTGFIGGYMTIDCNAGFMGAMIAGFAAGIITNEVGQFTGRLPKFIRKAAPIIIYPVFNLLLMQVITLMIISPISKAIGSWFSSILQSCVQRSSIAAGGLSAMMMAVDMGGIINKVAYNYGVNGILSGHTDIMASVMIGGMVPPIGIALSAFFFRNRRKYTMVEQDRSLSALFMGLSFITEGALPYVFTDFGRVIPTCMLGSGVAGLLSMVFGCELPAPHGGIFVLPVMSHPLLYLLALAVGSCLTAVTLGLWKKEVPDSNDGTAEEQ
jgi:fructose-specific phosphotransferase system IIC component